MEINSRPSITDMAAMVIKILIAPILEAYEATKPPIILATKLLRNQTPISSEASFTGASLVTIESPMGDRSNSPKVWNK
jgi:hypothetical protein